LGGPFPAKEKWEGWGYEYKSLTTVFGLSLLHISFKCRPNRVPVPAKGIIAIGLFGCGIFTLARFGISVVGIGQFMAGGWLLAQFAAAYSLVAQFGIYIHECHGQIVKSVLVLL
jgi:hypothetical protein